MSSGHQRRSRSGLALALGLVDPLTGPSALVAVQRLIHDR